MNAATASTKPSAPAKVTRNMINAEKQKAKEEGKYAKTTVYEFYLTCFTMCSYFNI